MIQQKFCFKKKSYSHTLMGCQCLTFAAKTVSNQMQSKVSLLTHNASLWIEFNRMVPQVLKKGKLQVVTVLLELVSGCIVAVLGLQSQFNDCKLP